VARPLSIYIDTHGTGKVPGGRAREGCCEAMDLTPRGIRTHLDLNRAHRGLRPFRPYLGQ
jgi:S-adenosylmethionine synthetase